MKAGFASGLTSSSLLGLCLTDIKKDKAKKKFPMAKLFGWGNKKEA